MDYKNVFSVDEDFDFEWFEGLELNDQRTVLLQMTSQNVIRMLNFYDIKHGYDIIEADIDDKYDLNDIQQRVIIDELVDIVRKADDVSDEQIDNITKYVKNNFYLEFQYLVCVELEKYLYNDKMFDELKIDKSLIAR